MNYDMILIVVPIVLLLLIVPVILIAEIMYHWARTEDYPDLEGFNSLELITEDNIKIQSWYTKSSNKLAVIVHGHDDNSHIMNEWYGDIFSNLGYDLFFIDLRNHGRSDIKKPIGLGVFARFDIIAALEWINQQDWDEVILFGTSMGSIANIFALKNINPDLYPDKMIIDSTFVDNRIVLENTLRKFSILHPWNWLVVQYLVKLKYSEFKFPDVLSAVEIMDIPLLVIHGSNDVVAPVDVIDKLEKANINNLSTHIFHGADHSRLFRDPSFSKIISKFLEVANVI